MAMTKRAGFHTHTRNVQKAVHCNDYQKWVLDYAHSHWEYMTIVETMSYSATFQIKHQNTSKIIRPR